MHSLVLSEHKTIVLSHKGGKFIKVLIISHIVCLVTQLEGSGISWAGLSVGVSEGASCTASGALPPLQDL